MAPTPRAASETRSVSLIRTPPIRMGAEFLRVALTGAAASGVILVHGFREPILPLWALSLGQIVLMAAYWADVVVRQRRGTDPLPDRRLDWVDGCMAGLLIVGLLAQLFLRDRAGWMIAETAIVWTLLAELWRLYAALSRRLARPGVLMPLSFLLLIAVGTVLLKMPVASAPGAARLSWLDSLFTMTSAVCVTGLTVRDTAHDFSPLGQTLIGVFILLGGLGIIVFGSMLVFMVGHAVSVRGERHLSQMLQDEPIDRLRRSTRYLVMGTLLIQLAGAAAMYPLWRDDASGGEALTSTRRIGLSLFHAVSAFCNAGFDTLGSSMMQYRHSGLTHLVIAPLIVLGGLGFPALQNIARVCRARLRGLRLTSSRAIRTVPTRGPVVRLSVHSKLVIYTTLGLYAWGVLTIGVGQYLDSSHLLRDTTPSIVSPVQAPGPERSPGSFFGALADASFMSVSARTAGFNSLPMTELAPASRFSLVTLMIVGGSPGGAAGGFKTTVLAVLILSVVATIRQRRETEVFKRSIADSLVRQAGTIVLCYVLLIVVSTMLLLLTERAPFGVVFFEAVSAASTTGLSLGLTAQLTPFGKAVIIATMFLGRVGPLALFAALAFGRGSQRPYSYPHESISLG